MGTTCARPSSSPAAFVRVCMKFGVMEALPTKAEIIQLLQREDIDLLPGGD